MRWVGLGLVVAGGLIGLAIGVDDAHLSTYQLKVWGLAAQSLGGVALLGGIARYLSERRRENSRYLKEQQRELAWRKTTFIAELFVKFDQNDQYQQAMREIDAAYATRDYSFLEKVLGSVTELDQTELELRRSIDRYLDFFDRLYTHVFITKTLAREDVSSFWGYALDIRDTQPLKEFALAWGYEDVLRLADEFEGAAAERDELIDALA